MVQSLKNHTSVIIKMNKIQFEFAKDKNNQSYFEQFLKTIPLKEQVKFLSVIEGIETYGLLRAKKLKTVKKLENNLYEIRIKFSSNIHRALYFHIEGSKYVITHGFTKKQDKTPEREKARARRIRNTYQGGI